MNIRVKVEIGQQATTYEEAELLLAVLKEELKTSKIGRFEAELMMFGGIVDIFVYKEKPDTIEKLSQILKQHGLSVDIKKSKMIWIDIFVDHDPIHEDGDLRDFLEESIHSLGYGDVCGAGASLDGSSFDFEVKVEGSRQVDAIKALLDSKSLKYKIKDMD